MSLVEAKILEVYEQVGTYLAPSTSTVVIAAQNGTNEAVKEFDSSATFCTC